MTRYSFAEVRAVFVTNTVIESFGCIANPYNRNDCPNQLWPERVEDAQRLFRRAESGMMLDDLRDIINCLLCVDCQRGYTHKDKVERKWSSEFPEFPMSEKRFAGRRRSSPYSAKNARGSDTLSRGPSRSFSPSPNTPMSDRDLSPNYLATPPSQPIFRPVRQGRSDFDTGAISTPHSSSSNLLEVPEHNLDHENESRRSRSPSVRSTEGRIESSVQTQTVQAVGPVQVLNDVAMLEAGHDGEADVAVADAGVTQAGLSDNRAPETLSQEASHTFCVGAASTCAPWAIRDEVLALILEPLPTPKSKGTLYAVRVADTPYLKIGYTMRKVKDRLKEISEQHKVNLETDAAKQVQGIPYLQLLRLEALVHADLAYSQRTLRMRNGKQHREYFEVDLAIAERCMNMWWRIMQDIRLEPGRELHNDICEELKADPVLNMETSETHMSITRDGWPAINANHTLREGVWMRLFKLEQGGFRKSHRWILLAEFIASSPLWLHVVLGTIGLLLVSVLRTLWK